MVSFRYPEIIVVLLLGFLLCLEGRIFIEHNPVKILIEQIILAVSMSCIASFLCFHLSSVLGMSRTNPESAFSYGRIGSLTWDVGVLT